MGPLAAPAIHGVTTDGTVFHAACLCLARTRPVPRASIHKQCRPPRSLFEAVAIYATDCPPPPPIGNETNKPLQRLLNAWASVSLHHFMIRIHRQVDPVRCCDACSGVMTRCVRSGRFAGLFVACALRESRSAGKLCTFPPTTATTISALHFFDHIYLFLNGPSAYKTGGTHAEITELWALLASPHNRRRAKGSAITE